MMHLRIMLYMYRSPLYDVDYGNEIFGPHINQLPSVLTAVVA